MKIPAPMPTIEDKDKQYDLAMKVFDEKLSVRETEKIVKKMLNPEKKTKTEQLWTESEELAYNNMEEKIKEISLFSSSNLSILSRYFTMTSSKLSASFPLIKFLFGYGFKL